jgi:filamentous hemagglutinin
MELPGAESASVGRAQIVEYLLDPAHRPGASKARFFEAFGFHIEHGKVLAQALREHGQHHDVDRAHETPFGPRYEADGVLRTPTDANPAYALSGGTTTLTIAPGP